MSTRQVFKTVDVLRLEVEGTWPSLPNIVPNPRAEFGGWGWRQKAQSATVAAISGPAFRLTRGTFAASCGTNPLPLEPNWGPGSTNRWVKGSIRRVGGTSGMQVNIQFLDKFGGILSQTTLSASQTVNGTITLPAAQAPTLARYAAINIAHNGGTSGDTIEFTDAILVTGTQSEVTAATLSVEAPWVNLLNTSTSVQIKREGLNLGTLSAVVRDSSLDPATANTIRKGKKVRALALSATSGTWETLFRGKVDTASVTYDLLHSNASKRSRIELNAVDAASTLASSPRPNSVPNIADLPDILDGTGVPWNVNGSTAPVWPVNPVATDANASALTQVGLTRDTTLGYAWVSRRGVLNAWDRLAISTTVAATLNEPVYTDLEIAFNPADLINDVTVKVRAIDPVTGETSETTYGPFRDDVSAQEWGKYHKDFTVVGPWTLATAESFANSVMIAASQPRLRVNNLRMPVTDAAHIDFRALIDLYDVVTVANTAKGINQNLRPTAITHDIEPEKWVMDLTFSEIAGVAAPMPPDRRVNYFQPATAGLEIDTPWATPTLDNGWVAYGAGHQAPRYRRKDGVVYLQGMVKSGTAGTQILALPAGFRPAGDKLLFPSITDSSTVGRLDVFSNGSVTHTQGGTTYTSLSGISFPAEQ